jgi:hypothetical protein
MRVYVKSNGRLVNLILLVIASTLLLAFIDSAMVFTIAVFLTSVVSISELYRLVSRPHEIRFLSTIAVSILLGYGLGSAVYLVANGTIDATEYQYWINHGLSFDQSGLSMALVVSVLASLTLYAFSPLERPVFYSVNTFVTLADAKSRRLVWLGVVLAGVALVTGSFGYMGVSANEAGNVSPIGVIASLMVPALVPYTLLLITDKCSMRGRYTLILALLFFIVVLFIIGRRYLLYVAVLSAVALFLRSHKRHSTSSLLRISALAIVLIVILFLGFKFFMALRFTMWELGSNAGLPELLSSALSSMVGDKGAVVDEALAKNIGSRTFILSYLAGLMGLSSASMPAWGLELMYSLQMTVPSVLMPSKLSGLPSEAEALVHPLYGIPVFDGPNSFLVAGFDDLGYFGCLLYPLFIAVLYRFFYRVMCLYIKENSTRLFMAFVLLFGLLFIEQSLSSGFLTLRNLLIVVGVAWGLNKVPILRLGTFERDAVNRFRERS